MSVCEKSSRRVYAPFRKIFFNVGEQFRPWHLSVSWLLLKRRFDYILEKLLSLGRDVDKLDEAQNDFLQGLLLAKLSPSIFGVVGVPNET